MVLQKHLDYKNFKLACLLSDTIILHLTKKYANFYVSVNLPVR